MDEAPQKLEESEEAAYPKAVSFEESEDIEDMFSMMNNLYFFENLFPTNCLDRR